jgi:protein N-terminal asparagine amidohydrolase
MFDYFQMLEVYDCSREELRIGPFSYEPMRAVDIWLQQSDDFLLQSLSSSPDVAPPHFVPHLRSTLKRIKDDPYPSVTLFHNNLPRYYRKDDVTGQWMRYQKEEVHPVAWPPITNTQAYY